MTGTLKYHNGTGWVRIPWAKGDTGPQGIQGIQGEVGPQGVPATPPSVGSSILYGTIDGVPNMNWGNNATISTGSIGRMWFQSFMSSGESLTKVHVSVTTADLTPGTLARCGLYLLDKDTWAGTDLVQDFGTVPVDTTGLKTIDLGTPLTLTEGQLYVGMFVSDGTPIVTAPTLIPILYKQMSYEVISNHYRGYSALYQAGDNSAYVAAGLPATCPPFSSSATSTTAEAGVSGNILAFNWND